MVVHWAALLKVLAQGSQVVALGEGEETEVTHLSCFQTVAGMQLARLDF